MGIFKKNKKKSRTIEEILTPKEVEEDVSDCVDERENESKYVETLSEDNVKTKDGRVETPEESSFNALTCFGWSESKTPKGLIKCAHVWYWIMSFAWFIFGAITFAPIIFVYKKVNVVFKDKTKSFIVAIGIYCLFIALLVLLIVTRNADAAIDTVETLETSIQQ